MVAYKLDNALVAKYPTSEERRASSSNNDKASASEDHDGHVSTKKKPTRSRQNMPERGLTSQWRQASARDSIDDQASVGEEAKTSTATKHP
jgi:hypothetical protein